MDKCQSNLGRLFLLAILGLVYSCGMVPLQPVHLRVALDVPLVSVNIGRRAKVFVRFVDDRSQKTADTQKSHVETAPYYPSMISLNCCRICLPKGYRV